MKYFASLLLVATVIVALTSMKKNTVTTENDDIKLKNQIDSVSYALGILYGEGMKQQGFDDLNNELFLKVLSQSLNNKLPKGEKLLIDQKNASPIVNNYFIQKRNIVAATNLKKGEAFLAANKTKEGVKTTSSGLQYKVIKEGTGATPTPASGVSVYYKGMLLNGTVFDATKPNTPANFSIGGLIQGWKEGLLLMKEGAKFEFYVPSNLAYGPQGSGKSIGPNEVLIFEVELLKVD